MLRDAAVPGETSVPLVLSSGGYVLDVNPGTVDLHRFRRLVGHAGESGRPDAERVLLLREALALWHGEPLAGLPGVWAAQVRQTLLRQRLDAMIAWANAEWRTGNPSAVIGPVMELLGEWPLVEPLTATLMRALHAVSRGAEALDHYASTRRRLLEELGTEPGTELRELHRAILCGDLDRPVTSAVGRRAPPGRQVPAQLPPDLPGFVGRGADLTRLDEILAAAKCQPTSITIATLVGPPGVGKTTLAVHWAHRVVHRFPDGQLYLNLRGFDPAGPPMHPARALRGFLHVLGVPPMRVPASIHEQAALYRSLLADRRMLVLLDNARDADQIRPLLPGAPGCMVVVTSRNAMSGLVAVNGAEPVPLDVLTLSEARMLLARRLGRMRVAAEARAADDIIARCARLPLALAAMVARAAVHPDWRLSALAGQLRDARIGLDVFADRDASVDVRAVFSWSYQRLSAEAAGLFRLLSVHPGPDITAAAAASLAGMPVRRVRALLDELIAANLITEQVPGRYSFHDLLRAYATELAHTHDRDADRRAAALRMLDHYLHSARNAASRLEPRKDPTVLPEAEPGVTPEVFSDHRPALTWFEAEHRVLLAVVDLAARAGFDVQVCRLAATIVHFWRRGYWHDWETTQSIALAAAQRLADPAMQAAAHRGLFGAYLELGRLDDAHHHIVRAIELSNQAGDPIGEAFAFRYAACCSIERAGRRTGFPTSGRPSSASEPLVTSAGRPLHSTGLAGSMPNSAITTRPSPTANSRSTGSSNSRTSTDRPPPTTASATCSTSSATTRKR